MSEREAALETALRAASAAVFLGHGSPGSRSPEHANCVLCDAQRQADAALALPPVDRETLTAEIVREISRQHGRWLGPRQMKAAARVAVAVILGDEE